MIKLLMSFISTFAFIRLSGVSSFHISGLIYLVLFYFLFKYTEFPGGHTEESGDRRPAVLSRTVAFLFVLFTVLADYRRIIGGMESRLFIIIIISLTAVGLFLVYQRMLLLIFRKAAEGRGRSTDNCVKTSDGCVKQTGVNSFFGGRVERNIEIPFFAALIVTRIPYILTNYPGIMTVDSLNQYGQIAGFLPPSNHHPYIHTLLISLFIRLGTVTGGGPVGGIFLFSLFQMTVCALIHTYGAHVLRKLGASKIFLLLYFAFYGLVPYNAQYSITMWKDILFSASVTLFTTTLIIFLAETAKRDGGAGWFEIKSSVITRLLFVLSALGMCLFRSNGFMAFTAALPFVALAMLTAGGEHRERAYFVTVAGVAVIITTVLITGPLFKTMDIRKGDTVEALSIPIQMAARVYAEGQEVSVEHDEGFRRILDTGRIPEEYEDFCSDHMKNLIREGNQDYIRENPLYTAKLWLDFGLAHPLSYLRGFIDATKGYYYPDIPNIIGADYSIAPNEYGIKGSPVIHNSVSIKIDELIVKLPTIIPVIGYLYSPGWFFWCFVVALSVCFIRKGIRDCVVFLPNLMVFLTLMAATPVNNEFRYIYSLVLCTPLYIEWSGFLGSRYEGDGGR